MPWGLCVGESVCHRTNIEKVGRKGSPRRKRRGLYPFFSPYSPACSLSVSAVFNLRKRARDNKMLFFFFFSRLLFSSNAIFALSVLSIYTFSASSNSKWERLFPCAAPCVYLAMFPTAPRHRAGGEVRRSREKAKQKERKINTAN